MKTSLFTKYNNFTSKIKFFKRSSFYDNGQPKPRPRRPPKIQPTLYGRPHNRPHPPRGRTSRIIYPTLRKGITAKYSPYPLKKAFDAAILLYRQNHVSRTGRLELAQSWVRYLLVKTHKENDGFADNISPSFCYGHSLINPPIL